ncbi:sigma-70 family RNA polymerase sigma factor [Brevibacillus ginsengisoli]|uniref:sigma-70 family RNA polymerase sigma factor n=1 Tax=Brevibacillus ginsengisoli TaxID=363854 RepID=UPI003CFAA0D3
MKLEENVQLAQNGDKDAFIRLINHIELKLYGVARAIVKRDEDCADAIQEAILKAYRALHTLKDPAYFKTWMFRILIHECQQILRRQKRIVTVSEFPTRPSHSSSDYERIDLREAVDRLEETLRIVITLHYFEDMPLKQIAELLETPEGTIKSRLNRARSTLAEWLKIPEERKTGYEC